MLTAHTLAFIQNIGMMEWVIILIVALLLFGRRLPEVGRSLGKGIVEFKKGLSGVEDDVKSAGQQLPQNMQTMPPAHGQSQTVSRSDNPH